MDSDIAKAARAMSDFAERTGVGAEAHQRRYLWTDAFALMNALALWHATGEGRCRDLATDLIEDVHRTLGRHRPDDPRQGWLSGFGEAEGARHPTRGGLRIGKPLPERGVGEPLDERLEWDRDGQYWHYLTKWMDALSRAAVLLGEPRCQTLANDLAATTFPRFLRRSATGKPLGLAWKMSVDLTRPLVDATSPHDALEGYVTFRWLDRANDTPGLAAEAATLRPLAEGRNWATGEPLGLGGLLLDAVRIALLPDRAAWDDALILAILEGADAGLAHVMRSDALDLPAAHRLGFRELGLAIGLRALPALAEAPGRHRDTPHLAHLRANIDVASRIVGFWCDPRNRRSATWTERLDINEVMLATALIDAFAETARPTAVPAHSAP